MRRNEALGLTWERVDLRGRRVTAERTKSKKVRSIPISDYAVEKLRGIVRYIGQPAVFCYGTRRPMVKPYKADYKAARAVGLDWVTFHMLRHMRGTLWVKAGVDLRTVQEMLGHSAIATTMRYVKLVESPAEWAIRKAQEQEKEASEIAKVREKSVRGDD